MSKRPNNPFFVKGVIPEEYFCDRKEETRHLIRFIVNGHNVVLSSPRRIGKTGLIDHCFAKPELKGEYYTFFVDILNTSCLREFTYAFGQAIFETLKPLNEKMVDLFIRTVTSVTSELSYDATTGMPKFSFSLGAIRNPDITLGQIFEYIDKADKRCVIAIDEFQQIVHYPEKNIEAILRTYIQHCRNAEFIFAGSERHILAEMFNLPSRPFFASTSPMSLDPIDRNVYKSFVIEHFEEYDKSVDPDAVDYVYEMFDGNTFCMQRVFNTAFSSTDIDAKCDVSLVKKSIEDILQENRRNFQNRLSLLTPKPKELLYAIACEGKASRITSGGFVRKHHLSSPSSVQSALKQLMELDLVNYDFDHEGTKRYFVCDQFLSLWIRQRFGR